MTNLHVLVLALKVRLHGVKAKHCTHRNIRFFFKPGEPWLRNSLLMFTDQNGHAGCSSAALLL